MNMNTEKKQTYSRNRLAVAIVTILLLGVAMIGIGYATASHTGTMTDSGDSTTTTYLTLTNKDSSDDYTGHFSNDIVYDTANNGGTITYTPQTTNITISGTETGVVKLGSKDITVTQTGTQSAYTLNVKAIGSLAGSYYVGFTIDDGTEYYVEYNASTGATSSEINAVASNTITVALYIVVTGSTTAPTDGYSNIGFTFTATTV